MLTDSITSDMPLDSVSAHFAPEGYDHDASMTFDDSSPDAGAPSATAQLRAKSFAFALRIVKLQQYLAKQHERLMSAQLLRCGTAIGVLARAAEQADGRELGQTLALARKEAIETEYWLELLHQSGYINAKGFASIQPDIAELLKLIGQLIRPAKAQN